MSDAILQYQDIRNTITSNLNVIKQLLEQAENMHNLIESLDDGDQEDKIALQHSINNIYKSIDLLTEQTHKLFESFIKFAGETEVIRT
jgi:hypothetical protein